MELSEKRFKKSQVSVGVTWIDSKLIFKDIEDKKRTWLGVCHLSFNVMSFAPYDYKKITTAVTTTVVDPVQNYCEKAYSCVAFHCPLNRFDRRLFLAQYNETSNFSMALPVDFGTKPLWFNENRYPTLWRNLIILFNTQPEGGLLEFSMQAYDAAQSLKK